PCRNALGKAASFGIVSKSNWLENRLHDFAPVHLFEGFVPFSDGPHSADDGRHLELATAKQSNDALPHGPVVTEAALHRDVLLHERIEVEIERLRAPAYLADPSRGADEVERNLERGTRARGIDHAIATEAIALLGPRFRVTNDHFAAVLLRDVEAMRVLG